MDSRSYKRSKGIEVLVSSYQKCTDILGKYFVVSGLGSFSKVKIC